MSDPLKILIYGYGNPGRQDDGLGNEFVRRIEDWVQNEDIESIEFDSNYQLNIEDAESIAAKDLVIFVDASAEDIQDFLLTRITGEHEVSFTSHAASPGYIVKLAGDLFNRYPDVFLLHIKGYSWDFLEGLTPEAQLNLEKTLQFIKPIIKDPLNYLYNGKFNKSLKL